MKLCINCKYSKGSKENPECDHPKNKYIDQSTGKETAIFRFCKSHRTDTFPVDIMLKVCGKRGRWFKKIEP